MLTTATTAVSSGAGAPARIAAWSRVRGSALPQGLGGEREPEAERAPGHGKGATRTLKRPDTLPWLPLGVLK